MGDTKLATLVLIDFSSAIFLSKANQDQLAGKTYV